MMNIMQKDQNKTSLFFSAILYMAGFFLFLEWLYPLEQITDTSSITVFILFAVLCFVITFLQIPWWASFLLKGSALLILVNVLFFTERFLSGTWFDELLMEMALNADALFSMQWYYLTPMFRSVLFLILIWLMSYLLHYWFVMMKQIFVFVLLTFFYLAILDTFTVYDGDVAIVRTFVISFLALGIANLMKELDKESIHFSWLRQMRVWLLPVVAIVLLASLFGFAAPKFDPQWPDPVPFIQSAAENAGGSAGGGTVQKVGYGEDDSQLGGSFVQDNTPVFQATVEKEHYWRIETKDVYTGKGWEMSEEPDYELQDGGEIALQTFTDQVETEELEASLTFQGNTEIEKLIYPYGVDQVSAGGDLLLDDYAEAIQTQQEGEPAVLTNYSISYDHPSYERNSLREENGEDPEEIMERFTQLPDELPERVGELAEEITELDDNRYDMAKSIENYFSQSNGFTYQTTDVPVPQEDEDYVDQFLFDSKVGYCDNFSSSMVVMLRTLDIPARWVKGFTSGEVMVTGTGDEPDVYQVTNANAHSWVEVYFPQTGWVPFEPTQGFSNLSDFHTDIEESSDWNEDDLLEAEERAPEPPEADTEEPEEEVASAPADNQTGGFNLELNWTHISIITAVVLLLGFVGYKTRFRWQAYLLAKRFNSKPDAKTYQDAYHHLMRILAHQGLKKDPDQTLREYAKRIDDRFATDNMGRLTNHFEHILYRDELNSEQASELTQLWKDLIKRVMG
ncbi:transglutaminase TgpA family protein [Lentibacillus sediminis]|uniref:transglutaminase TgpA family protein n=1 Tax=Lentibacillus sediminis TaxID=1940529 RepID=UPI000C1B8472|nr:DUF3488 and transglutaminase-like domain-containing protein [Lentibacillus sediminis]